MIVMPRFHKLNFLVNTVTTKVAMPSLSGKKRGVLVSKVRNWPQDYLKKVKFCTINLQSSLSNFLTKYCILQKNIEVNN